MSNTERKARKRAGIPLHREPKVGTPIEDRAKPGYGKPNPIDHGTDKERARALADAARARRAARTTDAPTGRAPRKSTAARKAG